MAEQFKPYKYIKELFNTERLILPAVRDTVINGIFLGGAESDVKGETLLDTVNYPLFDLWTYIINQYKYSFFESTRGELLVVPDMMCCLPPLCNVVFPDEYVHYGRNINLRDVTTRFTDQGYMTLTGNDRINADIKKNIDKKEEAQQAFFAPTSDIEPLIHKIIAGECTPKKIPSNVDGDEFEVYSQIPLPEEFHFGANYKTGDGEYLSRMSEDFVRRKMGKDPQDDPDDDGNESFNLVDEYNNYHKLNVLYKYFLSRLRSQKTENVRLTFTPRLVNGLPILLLSREGRHLFGLLTNLSHNIQADGVAETIVTIEYQFNYDDITSRPIYFYRQQDREELIQESENSDDESTYVWKNYMMLSGYFRDKFIGSKMYKSILCDDINSADYNSSAWKDLKDKSILGVLNKKYDSLIDSQRGAIENSSDRYYFDGDRPNVSGEVFTTAIGEGGASSRISADMIKQKKRMMQAVELIYAGYLSADDKDDYKNKFDIYPLRNFDHWMAELGAYRNADGNFRGVKGDTVNWVSLAKTEMEKRYKSYLDNIKDEVGDIEKRKAEIETEKKKIDEIKKRKKALEDQKRKLEAEKDKIKKEEDSRSKTSPYNTDPGPSIVDPKQRVNEDLQNNKKERIDVEKELKAAKKGLNELQRPIEKMTEEQKFNDYSKLNNNPEIKKYDIDNHNFTTNGPFCLEKQNYFRNVYAKSLQENHFETEFRSFETTAVKPKDIGNDITKIVHNKGSIGNIPKKDSPKDTPKDTPKSNTPNDSSATPNRDVTENYIKKIFNDTRNVVYQLAYKFHLKFDLDIQFRQGKYSDGLIITNATNKRLVLENDSSIEFKKYSGFIENYINFFEYCTREKIVKIEVISDSEVKWMVIDENKLSSEINNAISHGKKGIQTAFIKLLIKITNPFHLLRDDKFKLEIGDSHLNSVDSWYFGIQGKLSKDHDLTP